mmetsp:Transcript_19901/g.61584  ORF Transcript_19901/g.61584 Transcript_19901/m.61584 type:complete len:259 (-) Transcript_19901:200-976(-)
MTSDCTKAPGALYKAEGAGLGDGVAVGEGDGDVGGARWQRWLAVEEDGLGVEAEVVGVVAVGGRVVRGDRDSVVADRERDFGEVGTERFFFGGCRETAHGAARVFVVPPKRRRFHDQERRRGLRRRGLLQGTAAAAFVVAGADELEDFALGSLLETLLALAAGLVAGTATPLPARLAVPLRPIVFVLALRLRAAAGDFPLALFRRQSRLFLGDDAFHEFSFAFHAALARLDPVPVLRLALDADRDPARLALFGGVVHL